MGGGQVPRDAPSARVRNHQSTELLRHLGQSPSTAAKAFEVTSDPCGCGAVKRRRSRALTSPKSSASPGKQKNVSVTRGGQPSWARERSFRARQHQSLPGMCAIRNHDATTFKQDMLTARMQGCIYVHRAAAHVHGRRNPICVTDAAQRSSPSSPANGRSAIATQYVSWQNAAYCKRASRRPRGPSCLQEQCSASSAEACCPKPAPDEAE